MKIGVSIITASLLGVTGGTPAYSQVPQAQCGTKGIIVQGGREEIGPKQDDPRMLAIGPKQDDPRSPALAIGPKQDDPRSPTLAIGPKQDDPRKLAIGPKQDDPRTPSSARPGDDNDPKASGGASNRANGIVVQGGRQQVAATEAGEKVAIVKPGGENDPHACQQTPG